jgi:CBS domain-containing protein
LKPEMVSHWWLWYSLGMDQDSVRSLMSSRVISVPPSMPILAAIDIILSNNYNGVPVVDRDGLLVGILTKYDLIIKRGYIQDDTKVAEVMNKEPLVLSDSMSVEDAVAMFSEHHKVDPIPVLNDEKKVVGVISRADMVRLFREYGISFDQKRSAVSKEKPSIWPLVVIIILGSIVGYLYYFGYITGLLDQIF